MKETISNLTKAFIGESQARSRYTFYSRAAQKEGYEQIAEIFLATADNEFEHAEWNMKMFNSIVQKTGKDIELKTETDFPHVVKTTAENLAAAIEGEHYETTKMYPEFADVALKEGFPDVAARLRNIAKAEAHHEERYGKILEQITNGTLFKKTEKVPWVCMKCGYVHEGLTPPGKCPVCEHDKSFYMLKSEEY